MACFGVRRSIAPLLHCLIFFLLLSCATSDKNHQLSFSDTPQNKSFDSGEFSVSWQELVVKDESQAQQFIKSRFDYFKSHFVDSYDPYFGVKTVPDDCQKKLYFHSGVIDDAEGFWSYAHYPQDSQRNIGCQHQAQKTVFIIRYCRESSLVKSFWIRLKSADDLGLKPAAFSCQGLMSYAL